MRFVGDIHGDLETYKRILEQTEGPSIQLGDFGIGFHGPYWHESVNELHRDGAHRFIRGNHDNPDKCANDMAGYIPDGLVENDVMFIGGAWSIDHKWRTVGVDWWANEELSYAELERLIETYSVVRPRIMVTHDCPGTVSNEMFIKAGKSLGPNRFDTRTGMALQAMFEIHQPELWVFGHWHNTLSTEMNGTIFQCVGINDFVDYDIEITNE